MSREANIEGGMTTQCVYKEAPLVGKEKNGSLQSLNCCLLQTSLTFYTAKIRQFLAKQHAGIIRDLKTREMQLLFDEGN